jgi:hypothetical protein
MITKDDLVAAVFDDARQAEAAIADLYQSGFALDKIDMVTRSQGETSATPDFAAQKEAAHGAVTGAATGAGVGALAGLAAAAAIMTIPGVGIVLGAGLLMGAIGGAALGATGGSLIGPFVALEMSEDDAHYYARAVKDEGRTVVLVQTPNRQADARAILTKHGGRDRRSAPAKPAVV